MRLMIKELERLARDEKNCTAMRYLIEAKKLSLLAVQARVGKKLLKAKIEAFLNQREPKKDEQ